MVVVAAAAAAAMVVVVVVTIIIIIIIIKVFTASPTFTTVSTIIKSKRQVCGCIDIISINPFHSLTTIFHRVIREIEFQ